MVTNSIQKSGALLGRIAFVIVMFSVTLSGVNYLLNPSVTNLTAFLLAFTVGCVAVAIAAGAQKIYEFWEQGRTA